MKILTASVFALALSCISPTIAAAADAPAASGPTCQASCQTKFDTDARACSTTLNSCYKKCAPADPSCVKACDATYNTCEAPNQAAQAKCTSGCS